MYTIKENFGPIDRSIRDYEKIAVKTVNGVIMERKNYTISHNDQPIVTFVSAISNDCAFIHVVDHIESTYNIKVKLDSESGAFNSLRLILNGKRIRVGQYSIDLWIDADKQAFTAAEYYFKQLSKAIEKLIRMVDQIPEGTQRISKPGRKFYRRAILLASLNEVIVTKDDLWVKRTRRAIIAYLEELLGEHYLGGFEQQLLDTLKQEASMDPITCNTLSGVYVDGEFIDLYALFTDDLGRIRNIISEYDFKEPARYCRNTSVQEYKTVRSVIEIEDQQYIDHITVGGTRICWTNDENFVKMDNLSQYMVYIPNKLWCSALLYEEVLRINVINR